MAKTTTKSQAKTKTTKKPAAKKSAAKKVAPTKTTAKQTKASVKAPAKQETKSAKVEQPAKQVAAKQEKPAVVVTPEKQKATKKSGPFAQIKKLHLLSAAIFVLLSAAAIYLMQAYSYQLTVSHLTRNELASTTSTVFAAAVQPVADVDVRVLLVGMLVFSAALSLWRVLKRQAKEQASLATHVIGLRWVDFAVTGSLMVAIVALAAGITDLALVKALCALVVASAVFAWFAERNNVALSKHTWTSYAASVVSGIVPLALIAVSYIATFVYGDIRYPGYVYALFGVLAIGGIVLALNQRKQIRGSGRWADYNFVEKNYLTISLVVKVAFAAILISGLS